MIQFIPLLISLIANVAIATYLFIAAMKIDELETQIEELESELLLRDRAFEKLSRHCLGGKRS